MAFHHRNRIEMKKQTMVRRETKEDRVQRSSNNQECIFLVCTSVFQLLWVGEIVWVYVSIRRSEQKLENYTDCQKKKIHFLITWETVFCDTCHYELKQGETVKPLL